MSGWPHEFSEWPKVTESGGLIWACCVSSIGPTCQHRTSVCWCGGEVGPRYPGDLSGLGCLENITHDWTVMGGDCSYTTSTADYCHTHDAYRANSRGDCERAL